MPGTVKDDKWTPVGVLLSDLPTFAVRFLPTTIVRFPMIVARFPMIVVRLPMIVGS